MKEIQDKLFAFRDETYAAFQARLAPNIPPETCMGVRLPDLRKFAKSLDKKTVDTFFDELPHRYYDENLLHSVLLASAKNYDDCLGRVEAFLPYVDNWAVCDTLRPKSFEKHKQELLPHVRRWIASDEEYTCRFGIDMLMTYYLDDAFLPDFLELPLAVTSEKYYVRMMVAWYYATALAKQWDATVPIIEQHKLCDWTHLKTIQKACESFRITAEQKEYLKSFR